MSPAPLLLALLLALTPGSGVEAAGAGDDADDARDVVFLADDRPVFVRFNVRVGGKPFRAAWSESVRALYDGLDRDGDGKLTPKEADKGVLAAVVRLATGDAADGPDELPAAGAVSVDDLAEAVRGPLGPFRVRLARLADGRADALFDDLDRDKDGQLTRAELAALAGSLRRLDLDDNEMIGADELEPFANPAVARAGGRGRFTAAPTVFELVPGESSLRPARLLLAKYDKGRVDGTAGRPDGKLSRSEFAVDPGAFDAADANVDGALGVDDLRKFLAAAPRDVVLDVDFPAAGAGAATVRVANADALAKGTGVSRAGRGDLEVAVGRLRIDLRFDDGDAAAVDARLALTRRFEAADANKDGYLEEKELAADKVPGSPLVGLFGAIDRDGDGKLYPKEFGEFVGRQLESARGRLVLTASDQGRAVFRVLDLDLDRRLGAREVMGTVDRVSSWDADGDGRVSPAEVPYHFRAVIARGGLAGAAGTSAPGASAAAVDPRASAAPAGGPPWFRKMDRNKDGDVSRREFLGPRDQFDRLDRDRDGLIDADEAGAADRPAPKADGR